MMVTYIVARISREYLLIIFISLISNIRKLMFELNYFIERFYNFFIRRNGII